MSCWHWLWQPSQQLLHPVDHTVLVKATAEEARGRAGTAVYIHMCKYEYTSFNVHPYRVSFLGNFVSFLHGENAFWSLDLNRPLPLLS